MCVRQDIHEGFTYYQGTVFHRSTCIFHRKTKRLIQNFMLNQILLHLSSMREKENLCIIIMFKIATFFSSFFQGSHTRDCAQFMRASDKSNLYIRQVWQSGFVGAQELCQ